MTVEAPPTKAAPPGDSATSDRKPRRPHNQVLVEEGCLTSSLMLVMPAAVTVVAWLVRRTR